MAYSVPRRAYSESWQWIWDRWLSAPERSNLNMEDVFVHSESSPSDLRFHYSSVGWNPYVILQDVTHQGPTTAHAVGLPRFYPDDEIELARWGDNVVLRVHTDVCWFLGKLTSISHVEPDPVFNPSEHVAMYENHDEIRGPLAVKLLTRFFL
jgi:hypothetical protein